MEARRLSLAAAEMELYVLEPVALSCMPEMELEVLGGGSSRSWRRRRGPRAGDGARGAAWRELEVLAGRRSRFWPAGVPRGGSRPADGKLGQIATISNLGRACL